MFQAELPRTTGVIIVIKLFSSSLTARQNQLECSAFLL
jgi:hypothetical protein